MVESSSVRVIILLNDILQRDIIRLALTRHGFEAVICPDASELPELLDALSPNALLIDSHLAQYNGIELLQSLSEQHKLLGIYVMMISSLGFPTIVRQAVEAGANDFMVKPLDIDLLVSRFIEYRNYNLLGQ